MQWQRMNSGLLWLTLAHELGLRVLLLYVFCVCACACQMLSQRLTRVEHWKTSHYYVCIHQMAHYWRVILSNFKIELRKKYTIFIHEKIASKFYEHHLQRLEFPGKSFIIQQIYQYIPFVSRSSEWTKDGYIFLNGRFWFSATSSHVGNKKSLILGSHVG